MHFCHNKSKQKVITTVDDIESVTNRRNKNKKTGCSARNASEEVMTGFGFTCGWPKE